MNIYIDGIFDLFHAGHIQTLNYIKNKFSDCFLIVGVINDKDANDYKRKPIISEESRYIMLENCKHVDKVIKNAPLNVTLDFVEKNQIDLVVHSFSDVNDRQKQLELFKDIIAANKFLEIPYSNKCSTSNIIKIIKDNY